jgi:hypothetical protein
MKSDASDAASVINDTETTLERQLYRAMNPLERVQRLRQGEAVPPPLTTGGVATMLIAAGKAFCETNPDPSVPVMPT